MIKTLWFPHYQIEYIFFPQQLYLELWLLVNTIRSTSMYRNICILDEKNDADGVTYMFYRPFVTSLTALRQLVINLPQGLM